MARPLRVEYPGAVYHITSRGNERGAIFLDDRDRLTFLEILKDYRDRFGVLVHSYVLMDNHYHLILETPKGNLLKVMHGDIWRTNYSAVTKASGRLREKMRNDRELRKQGDEVISRV